MKKIILALVLVTIGVGAFSQKYSPRFISKNDQLNNEYCTGIFKTQDATYFDLLDNVNNSSAMSYFNVLDWLEGRVAGLRVYKYRSGISLAYLRNQRAAIFLDEMPVSEDVLNMISVADIAMIKVMKDPFIGGSRGPGGAIAIYTIRGEEEDE